MILRRGMGADNPNQPGVVEQFVNALGTTLPLGETGLPVWVLVLAGVIASWFLLPKARDFGR